MGEWIAQLVADELSGPALWWLRQHLHRCGACQEEWQGMRTLRSRLQILQSSATGTALDARIAKLRAAQATQPTAPLTVRSTSGWRRVGLGFAAVALAATAATAPLWGPTPSVVAADVQAALAKVDTWHGIGWKTVQGKKLEWEVWGRKTPYFYAVRIGNQIRIDNGRERSEILPSDESSGHPGLALRTLSGLALDDWTIQPDQLFFSLPVEPQQASERWRTVTFRRQVRGDLGALNTEFVVDKRAQVPIRYEVRAGLAAEPTEQLRLEYGTELPTALTQASIPKNVSVIDLRGTPLPIAPSKEAEKGRFAVQAIPVGYDASGNVLVRVRGWADGVRLTKNAPLLMWVSNHAEAQVSLRSQDRQPTEYRYVPLEWLRILQHLRLGGDRLMLFTPATPLKPGNKSARRMTLKLKVALTPSPALRETAIFDSISEARTFTWELPLPQRRTPLNLDQHLGPGWRERVAQIGTKIEPVEAAIARVRQGVSVSGKKARMMPSR
jgi:hypothetical protein